VGIEAEAPHRFLPPTRTLRSGRSLESAVAVEPPTRPVPPSTSTRPLHQGGSVPGGGCGGRRRACSDHAHGGHSVGLSPRQAAARSDGDVRCGEALLERWTCQVCGR